MDKLRIIAKQYVVHHYFSSGLTKKAYRFNDTAVSLHIHNSTKFLFVNKEDKKVKQAKIYTKKTGYFTNYYVEVVTSKGQVFKVRVNPLFLNKKQSRMLYAIVNEEVK